MKNNSVIVQDEHLIGKDKVFSSKEEYVDNNRFRSQHSEPATIKQLSFINIAIFNLRKKGFLSEQFQKKNYAVLPLSKFEAILIVKNLKEQFTDDEMFGVNRKEVDKATKNVYEKERNAKAFIDDCALHNPDHKPK
tara:strand:- start:75 stop:482 length:408 start_codon:yes stop_codon:yes gene_type:complete